MFFSYINKNNYSHKLMYEGYLKLICRILSDDMYTKLTRLRIVYKEITCIYEKTHVIVMQVIPRLEITMLSSIKR